MLRTSTRVVAAVALLLIVGSCRREPHQQIVQPKFPDTPKETYEVVAQGLVDHHPEILWEALPESYRTDVVELTQLFVETMDPEVYDRAFAVLNRAVAVMSEKKGLILESSTLASTGVDIVEIDRYWTSSLSVASTFLQSELSTLQGLGAVVWPQYLETTGHRLMDQAAELHPSPDEDPLTPLAAATVEVVTESEDAATLNVTAPGEEEVEIQLVRVEDRWIPAELADQWPQVVAAARERMQSMTPEQIEGIKMQVMIGLGVAEGLIEQVAAIESVEEFDEIMGAMLESILGTVTSMMPAEA